MDTSLSIGSRSDQGAQIQRLWHGHERRTERREERREARRDDRQEAFAELKVKVQQTLQGTATPQTEDSGSSDDESGDGGFQAEVKLSIKVSGSGDGSAFAGALQGFTEALFSALQTLYGSPAQSTTPAAPVSAPTPTDDTAVDAAPVTTEPVATTDAPAPPAAPTASSGSLTIRLRLAYSSFDSQLGTLTNRLAQPQTTSEVPAVGAMFGDLSDRFTALQNAAGQGHDPARPSFASFLASLASSFGGNGNGSGSGSISMSLYFSASLSSGRVYATA